jgi:hypothetical protein
MPVDRRDLSSKQKNPHMAGSDKYSRRSRSHQPYRRLTRNSILEGYFKSQRDGTQVRAALFPRRSGLEPCFCVRYIANEGDGIPPTRITAFPADDAY